MTTRILCQTGTRHPDTWHSTDPAEQAEARNVCLACPARAACQTAVLATEAGWPAADRHGIYAALDGQERADLDPTAPAKPVRVLAVCGTPAAHRRHLRRSEPVCAACREDNRQRAADYGAARRARKATAA